MSDAMEQAPRTAGFKTAVDNVNVAEILGWILLGKKRILLCGLVVGGLGLLAALYAKNTYTANAEILPPKATATASAMMTQMSGAAGLSNLGGLGGVASSLESKTAADVYSAMLMARPVQDELVKRFHLMDEYHAKTEGVARERLAAASVIVPTKESFISIKVTDRSPQQAMLLTNGYVDALRDLMHGLALTQAAQRRVFFEGQLEKSKDDLANAEVAFKQAQQKNHIISVDAQSRALIESASALRAQIAAKEVQLEALRSYSTENNPQVQLAEKELAGLRGQVSQMDSSAQGDYSGMALSTVPGAELDIVRASRELKYQENLYELLVKQYEGSRIDEAQDAPFVQVIEPAIVPERKTGPHRTLIVLGAMIVGLLIGCVWVLVRGWRASLPVETRAKFAGLRRAAFRW